MPETFSVTATIFEPHVLYFSNSVTHLMSFLLILTKFSRYRQVGGEI